MPLSILIVDAQPHRFHAMSLELRRLDLDVNHAFDADWAAEHVGDVDLRAIVLVAASQDLDNCRDLLLAAAQTVPPVPVLWVGDDPGFEGPARVLDAAATIEALVDEVAYRVRLALYPDEIVDMVIEQARIVLEQSFFTVALAGEPTLHPRRMSSAPISAVMPFRGREITGVIAVSGCQDHLATIFQRAVSETRKEPITLEETADLIGEMANQILGRIKQFFVARGHAFETSQPVFLRGELVEVRNRSGQPSLFIPFREVDGILYLQFAFDVFDAEMVDEGGDNADPTTGELLFL
jgi:CheY-specific phosphatase CheX